MGEEGLREDDEVGLACEREVGSEGVSHDGVQRREGGLSEDFRSVSDVHDGEHGESCRA